MKIFSRNTLLKLFGFSLFCSLATQTDYTAIGILYGIVSYLFPALGCVLLIDRLDVSFDKVRIRDCCIYFVGIFAMSAITRLMRIRLVQNGELLIYFIYAIYLIWVVFWPARIIVQRTIESSSKVIGIFFAAIVSIDIGLLFEEQSGQYRFLPNESGPYSKQLLVHGLAISLAVATVIIVVLFSKSRTPTLGGSGQLDTESVSSSDSLNGNSNAPD